MEEERKRENEEEEDERVRVAPRRLVAHTPRPCRTWKKEREHEGLDGQIVRTKKGGRQKQRESADRH